MSRSRAARWSDAEILLRAKAAQASRSDNQGEGQPCPPGQDVVYLIAHEELARFAIGRTSNFGARLSALRKARESELRVLALIACEGRADAKQLEVELHRACASWRDRGNAKWFRLTKVSKPTLDRIVLRSTNPEWVRYANRKRVKAEQKERLQNVC